MTEIPSRRDGDSKATKSVCCHSISFLSLKIFFQKRGEWGYCLQNWKISYYSDLFCKFAYTMGFLKFGQKIRNLA